MSLPFVILVEMNVRSAELMPEFRRLMDDNAKLSLKNEPGCRRFDVVLPDDSDTQILLYEIYDDEAAFAAHLKTEHFLTFHAASEHLLESRRIRRGALVCEASAGA